MITEAKAPGKLYLAGEYAITLPGQASIILAVDRYMTIQIEDIESSELIVESNTLGKQVIPLDQLTEVARLDEWRLTLQTLQILQTWLNEHQQQLSGLKITITSDLEMHGKKIGLGSSAALVVALIKGITKHYHQELSQLMCFKLGSMILMLIDNFKKGSMGDIAAASYSQVIFYQKFDNQWLDEQLHSHRMRLTDVINLEWPKLEIHHIPFPNDWQLLVGWTGQPADTQALLDINAKVARIYKERLGNKTTPLIKILEKNIRTTDYIAFKTNLRLNQKALIKFSEFMHIKYMTPKLHELVSTAYHRGFAAKISGAGNGDNGLAILKTTEDKQTLSQIWQRLGIVPLDLHIATDD